MAISLITGSILFLLQISAFAKVTCESTISKCSSINTLQYLKMVNIYKHEFTSTKFAKTLVLTYLRDVKKGKNEEATKRLFKANNDSISPEQQKMLDEWCAKYIDSVDGSTFKVILEKAGVTMHINGKEQLVYRGEKGIQFGKKFLNIWMGPAPPDMQIKADMMEILSKN